MASRCQPILHPPKPLYKPAFRPVYPPETAITASNPQLYYLKDEEIDLATFLKNAHTTPARATVGGEAGVRWKSHWLAVEGVQPLIKENPISQISEPQSQSLNAGIRLIKACLHRQSVGRSSECYQAGHDTANPNRSGDLGTVTSLSRIPASLPPTHRRSRTRSIPRIGICCTFNTKQRGASEFRWTIPFTWRAESSHALGIGEDS